MTVEQFIEKEGLEEQADLVRKVWHEAKAHGHADGYSKGITAGMDRAVNDITRMIAQAIGPPRL